MLLYSRGFSQGDAFGIHFVPLSHAAKAGLVQNDIAQGALVYFCPTVIILISHQSQAFRRFGQLPIQGLRLRTLDTSLAQPPDALPLR